MSEPDGRILGGGKFIDRLAVTRAMSLKPQKPGRLGFKKRFSALKRPV